jgi:hypothetical protein
MEVYTSVQTLNEVADEMEVLLHEETTLARSVARLVETYGYRKTKSRQTALCAIVREHRDICGRRKALEHHIRSMLDRNSEKLYPANILTR